MNRFANVFPRLTIWRLAKDVEFEEKHPRDEAGKFTAGGVAIDMAIPRLTPERIAELKQNPNVFWHSTASGDLRGGTQGLHVGTYQAAKEAMEATIGIRADGKDWDGTEEYGKTLLMGGRRQQEIRDKTGTYFGGTGFNARMSDPAEFPQEDFYAGDHKERATHSNGDPVSLTAKPGIFPVRIKGAMTNSRYRPMEDFKANSTMRSLLKRGKAKRGYYYENVGEDSGSISAVVPSWKHLEVVT